MLETAQHSWLQSKYEGVHTYAEVHSSEWLLEKQHFREFPIQHDKVRNILILGLNVPEGLRALEEADIQKFLILTLLS